ncbi:hypothetical protein CRYUN_Cryun16bG0079800 [Craigia yunnanensis]
MLLAHFMGDVHQPLHVDFIEDACGNTIIACWLACKFANKNAALGSILEDDYFRSRFPIQGGIRLADVFNQTFLTIVEAIQISGTFFTLAGIVVLAIVLTIVILIVLETKG